jgi:hypothetical protein
VSGDDSRAAAGRPVSARRPWFYSLNAPTQRGNLVVVTGGFADGGASASPSYASWWGARYAALVALAARHE